MADIYIVNKEDLEQVADKIREKNETSDPIVFPDGFSSGIDAVYNSARSDFKNIIARSVTEIEDDSVETVGMYGLANYTALINVNFPNLKEIATRAFSGCTNLALTSLPDSITYVGSYSFSGCSKLSLTSLSGKGINVRNGAFENCTGLTSMSLPESLTIGNLVFSGCSNLRSVTFRGIPASIGANTFSGCTNLLTINVPWAEGEVEAAPWGAANATVNYNYTEEE